MSVAGLAGVELTISCITNWATGARLFLLAIKSIDAEKMSSCKAKDGIYC